MNKKYENPNSGRFRQLIAAVFVVTGIVKISTGQGIGPVEKLIFIAVGCIALGLACWRFASEFVKERRARRDVD